MGSEGYLIWVRHYLNGYPVTPDELRAAYPPDPCTCAPGLGYVCPGCQRGD